MRMSMQGAVRWGIAVGWFLVSAGCREQPDNDEILVEIGDEVVRKSQFDAYVHETVQMEAPFAEGELKAALLDQFIEERLLLRAAKVEGIIEDGGDAGKLGAETTAERALEEPGARPDTSVHDVIRRLMDRILENVDVPEDDIRAYYEEHRSYYKAPEVVDISQILVETEEGANRILEELKKSPRKFEEIAAARSIGPEASRGGHLGKFRRGELPSSFEREVFDLGKGRLSGVVKTDFGFHLFRVNEVAAPRELSLEEVRDSIVVELLRQRSDETLAAYVEELKKRYPVRIHLEQLDFPYLSRQGVPAGDALVEPRSAGSLP